MTQPRKRLQAALFLSKAATVEAMQSYETFYVLTNGSEFQIKLAQILALAEGFSHPEQPISFTLPTATGELSLCRKEGSRNWEVTSTVDNESQHLSPQQKIYFRVKWVEDPDSSVDADGYIAIYRTQPMNM